MNTVDTHSIAQAVPPSFSDTFDTTGQAVTDTIANASTAWQIPFYETWLTFFYVAFPITLIFVGGIIYNIIRIRQIRHAEYVALMNEPPGKAMSMFLEEEGSTAGTPATNTGSVAEHWRKILANSQSETPSDWRLAIIEADILLDAVITEKGYTGETIGEKLKQVKVEDLNSIDAAWEAHKVRNKIAHEGASYELTDRETRRVINLFEKVFRELNVIG